MVHTFTFPFYILRFKIICDCTLLHDTQCEYTQLFIYQSSNLTTTESYDYDVINTFVFSSNRVLLVDRQESRPGEWLTRKFFGAFSSVCSTSMAIPIEAVAKAMVSNTLIQPEQKMEILENKNIASLGKIEGK